MNEAPNLEEDVQSAPGTPDGPGNQIAPPSYERALIGALVVIGHALHLALDDELSMDEAEATFYDPDTLDRGREAVAAYLEAPVTP